jgi:hypothetical protein
VSRLIFHPLIYQPLSIMLQPVGLLRGVNARRQKVYLFNALIKWKQFNKGSNNYAISYRLLQMPDKFRAHRHARCGVKITFSFTATVIMSYMTSGSLSVIVRCKCRVSYLSYSNEANGKPSMNSGPGMQLGRWWSGYSSEYLNWATHIGRQDWTKRVMSSSVYSEAVRPLSPRLGNGAAISESEPPRRTSWGEGKFRLGRGTFLDSGWGRQSRLGVGV